ncbi:MAG TPA: FliG C-terminal domain-containing protein [bacterium]|nr:FliG C-terminal domain-containing protein [bacterium]
MADQPELNEILERLEAVEHKLGVYYVPNAEPILEELCEKLEPMTLQAILREVDAKVLAQAMMGYKTPALKNLQKAMSKKSWEMIQDDVHYFLKLGVSEAAIRTARLEMMSIIKKLEAHGAVVLHVKESSAELEDWKKQSQETGTLFKKVEGLEVWKKDILDRI